MSNKSNKNFGWTTTDATFLLNTQIHAARMNHHWSILISLHSFSSVLKKNKKSTYIGRLQLWISSIIFWLIQFSDKIGVAWLTIVDWSKLINFQNSYQSNVNLCNRYQFSVHWCSVNKRKKVSKPYLFCQIDFNVNY